MAVEKVAVVGAGVAGLTAALSFARRGIACDIFEETKELREVGAGLQIVHVMGLVALLASLVLISLHLVGLAFRHQPLTDIAKEATTGPTCS